VSGGHSAVGSPTAVCALHRSAGPVPFDHPAGEAHGDTHGVGDGIFVETHDQSRRRRRHRSPRRSMWRAGRTRRTLSYGRRGRTRPFRGARRSRVRQQPPRTAPHRNSRGLGDGESGGDHRGAGMEDRGKVGVVVVQRMRQHTVGERGLGGGNTGGLADHVGLFPSPLLHHVCDGRRTGVESLGGNAHTERVSHTVSHTPFDLAPGSLLPAGDAERGQPLHHRRIGHVSHLSIRYVVRVPGPPRPGRSPEDPRTRRRRRPLHLRPTPGCAERGRSRRTTA
jgi:hypothetical protein